MSTATGDDSVNGAAAEPKYWESQPGVAPIKAEFVLWDKLRKGAPIKENDDDAAEGRQDSHGHGGDEVPQRSAEVELQQDAHSGSTVQTTNPEPNQNTAEPGQKKIRLSGAQKKALARQRSAEAKAAAAASQLDGADGKKKQRGQNKARSFHHRAGEEEIRLCTHTSLEKECTRPGCRFSHDIKAYMAARFPDIKQLLPQNENDLTPCETAHDCFAFKDLGQCPFGYRCRFGTSHIEKVEDGEGFQGSGYKLRINQDLLAKRRAEMGEAAWARISDKGEFNLVTLDTIKAVRRGKSPLSEEYLASIGEPLHASRAKDDKRNKKRGRESVSTPASVDAPQSTADEDKGPVPEVEKPASDIAMQDVKSTHGDEGLDAHPSRQYVPDNAPVRATEKRRLDWRGKLYLAPLTTVGNEPFRRLCADFGNDIFCSEMGLAQEFLTGNANEWSLVRRHPSEKTFGVQVCGARPQVLVPAAEQIVKHCDVDFIDVNCGCPIDLVFNKGAGSAMMGKANKLGQSLVGMSRVLGEIPLTIKIRTGIAQSSPVAHKLIPNFQSKWGLSAMTIHGRSRQQRYKTRADYTCEKEAVPSSAPIDPSFPSDIKECARVLRETAADEGLPPIPIFGNGDAYDYRAYYENMEQSGVDGIMIARGGLIKPWIFTEIKERRDWDISSRERLDMVGKLVDYGLEHWGSDQVGVNHVRRFVCESLSFTHRYVPVGLLERFPMHMNERAYPYKGRDELETLLGSDQASDWVKITEMFLGPAPDDWSFLPKHKAAAASDGSAEVQG
ncbi:tRNA-dihydrouridine synthase 3 [Microbotryomycetes sp. JL201]|nr:tRNA-dihydrouridine synthase 3 [Microbotryomycetes sp. JL201]